MDLDPARSKKADCMKQMTERDKLKMTLKFQTCMKANRSITGSLGRAERQYGFVQREQVDPVHDELKGRSE